MPSSTSQSDLYSSFLPSLSPHQDISPDRSSTPHTRPTLTEMVGIDLAVAQAVQNLQKLQEQQAALYSGIGVAGVPPQVSTPIPDTTPPTTDQQPGINILSSILASVNQPNRQPVYKDHADSTTYPHYSAGNFPGPTDPLALGELPDCTGQLPVCARPAVPGQASCPLGALLLAQTLHTLLRSSWVEFPGTFLSRLWCKLSPSSEK